MTTRRPLVVVVGRKQEIPAGDVVPIAVVATGTPDGTKLVRDDSTLVAPFIISPDLLAYAARHG